MRDGHWTNWMSMVDKFMSGDVRYVLDAETLIGLNPERPNDD